MKRVQVFSAAAALLFVATAAHAQRGQGDRRGRQDQHAQAAPQDQQRQGGDRRGGETQQRGTDRDHDDQARAEQTRGDQARGDQERARVSAEQSQRRVAEQSEQWRDRQNREAQQREQLERERRAQQEAQFQRERQIQTNRAYDRDRDNRVFDRDRDDRAFDRDRDDRFVHAYRYRIGSVYRETNQYGADVLRQAVDRGYEQGYRAGVIDRRDGARADFRRALDFESGGFGYTGLYVPQDDYSYYFREGFQRGYDDGYWSRSNYGTFSNGKGAILGAIALGILGLTLIH